MGGFYLNQPDPFFTDIEDAVSRQRGKPFNANSLDWATMKSWQGRGIPLHIILRVIERTREKINSLSYYIHAVEKEHAAWLPSQIGAGEFVAVNEPCGVCGVDICFKLHRPED